MLLKDEKMMNVKPQNLEAENIDLIIHSLTLGDKFRLLKPRDSSQDDENVDIDDFLLYEEYSRQILSKIKTNVLKIVDDIGFLPHFIDQEFYKNSHHIPQKVKYFYSDDNFDLKLFENINFPKVTILQTFQKITPEFFYGNMLKTLQKNDMNYKTKKYAVFPK